MFEIYNIAVEFDILTERSMHASRLQMKYENPWNHLFIDELNLAIYNTEREIELRGPAYSDYWSKLPREDQLIAESERELLIELLSEFTAVKQNFIFESFLPAELEKWGDTNWPQLIDASKADSKALAKSAIETADYAAQHGIAAFYPTDRALRIRQMRNMSAIIHFNNPAHNADERVLLTPWHEGERRSILPRAPKQREVESLRRWRDRLASIQNQLYRGWSFMMLEIDERENQLDGPTAAKHRLHTNYNVPVPTRESFLGWYQYSGVAFRHLSMREGQRLHGLGGFTPKAILTYIAPLMPMTKEHLSHSLINEDGSQSQFSLPAKSKGHLRGKTHNEIQYGFWEASTIVMDETHILDIATEALNEMSMPALSIHERHCDSVSGLESTVAQYFNGRVDKAFLMDGLTAEEARLISTEAADPYMNQHAPDDFWLPIRAPAIIQPWASLAKFYGVHLRFDISLDGTGALSAWQTGFELAAQWAMFASESERLAQQRHAMARFMGRFRSPHDKVSVKTKGVKQTFDFGGLDS